MSEPNGNIMYIFETQILKIIVKTITKEIGRQTDTSNTEDSFAIC